MNDRWRFKLTEDFKLEASPELEKMMTFASKASKELMESIMEYEERLILTGVSRQGLERLIGLCQAELKRRK